MVIDGSGYTRGGQPGPQPPWRPAGKYTLTVMDSRGVTEIKIDTVPGAFSYAEYAVPWRWRSIFRHPVRVIRSKLR